MSSSPPPPSSPPRSIVELCFDEEEESSSSSSGHKCGYCGGRGGSVSVGMWAHVLTPDVYQKLINRGWRRSGCYVYRPCNEVTCCPMYTIRCDATAFSPSKSMKKVIRRVNNFNWDDHGDDGTAADSSSSAVAHHEGEVTCPSATVQPTVPHVHVVGSQQPINNDDAKTPPPTCPPPKPPRPPKNKNKKQQQPQGQQEEDSLSWLLQQSPSLRLERVLVGTPEFAAGLDEEHALYVKYQVSVHNDKPNDVNQKQFKRFLIDTPIQPTGPYGSYHVRYYHHHTPTTTTMTSNSAAGRRLIAVGVVDILPLCVSSVYFFYDPACRAKLSLGTYGALQEIQMVRDLSSAAAAAAQITWYYMGFYIHSCSKMKYKAKFTPAQLLLQDHAHNQFIPLDDSRVKQILDTNVLNQKQQKQVQVLKQGQQMPVQEQDNQQQQQDLNKVLVLLGGGGVVLRAPDYGRDAAVLQRYANLVGNETTPLILVYRSTSA